MSEGKKRERRKFPQAGNRHRLGGLRRTRHHMCFRVL